VIITKRDVNIFTVDAKFNSIDEPVKMAVFSDVHFDSVKCDRKYFKKCLDYCLENNIYVNIHGDLFDVMGTFQDPRSKPQDIRKEYYVAGRGYLDLIVEDAYNFLLPYKEIILVISEGNHETNILRRHDVNILDRLAFMLRQAGGITHSAPYAGYILFNFIYGQTKQTQKYFWHHGKGGNAFRSKDVLHSQLDMGYVSDADVYVSGHSHNNLYDPSNPRMNLKTTNGDYKIGYTFPDWIKIGSFKKISNHSGWEVEKGFQAKLLGGWFIEFWLDRKIENKKDIREIKRKIYPSKFL
jgi:hypothetical protein